MNPTLPYSIAAILFFGTILAVSWIIRIWYKHPAPFFITLVIILVALVIKDIAENTIAPLLNLYFK